MTMRAALVAALAALVAALAAALALTGNGANERDERRPIADVLVEHADRLLALPGVVGAAEAQCDGSPCIAVLVAKRTAALTRQIPKRIEGYPVEVRETGEIEARGDE